MALTHGLRHPAPTLSSTRPGIPQCRSPARPPWLGVESVRRGVDGGARLQTWVFDEAVAVRCLCIGRTARPWSNWANRPAGVRGRWYRTALVDGYLWG